jgi:4'-phosphopantetheinyl transferase EntD
LRSNLNKKSNFLNKLVIEPLKIPGVVTIGYEYNHSEYSVQLYKKLNIDLPNSIQNSVLTRQSEFLVGRYTALEAVRTLGIKIDNISIGRHRNPIWPNGILGSITHTNQKVICSISAGENFSYLGIDLEHIIPLKLLEDIKREIINKDEEQLIKISSEPYQNVFTIIFSAKESIFKALYPYVECYFDFSVVEVVSICFNSNSLVLTLTKKLSRELYLGRSFKVHFKKSNMYIQTILAE